MPFCLYRTLESGRVPALPIPSSMFLILLGQAMMALPILLPLLFAAVFVVVYLVGLLLNLVFGLVCLFPPQAPARFISLQWITITSAFVASAVLAYAIWVYWTQPLIN